MITDLGDLPYNRARPILLRVESPTQLHELELNSPHLVADTPELWKRLIARHFPHWEKKNYVPKKPSSWYKVYARYKREHDAELAEAEAKLKNAFATLESEKEARKSKIVEQRLLPRPPRDGRAVGGARRAGPDLPSHLSFGGGSRTRLTDGQSFLKKARREAREVANRRALSTPTGQLPVRPGQIARAPEGMLVEHRIRQQPPIRINAPRNSRSRTEDVDPEQKEREARLLRLKSSHSSRKPQVLSDSEDDEDEPNFLADLFGEEDEEEPRSTSIKKTAAAAAPARPPPASTNPPHKSRNPPTLLSNSYRSDSKKRLVHSPPKSTPQGSSSPPLPPQQATSRHTQPANSRTDAQKGSSTGLPPPPRPQQGQPGAPAQASSSSSAMQKRKPDVDIFMRPRKTPRK